MRMVLTPQEQSLLGEARKWAMEHWNPHSDAWETARQFPREAYAQAAADGYLGLASSKQYGGRDLDALSCALVYEGLAYGDPSLTTYLHIFNSLVSQLEKWYHPAPEVLALIPDFVAGRKFMAFALSELDAGSDPAAGKAWCTEDGDDYVVTGDKAWVSNSHHDDYFMLIVHGPGDGMTMMLADRSTPGLTVDQDPERIAGCAISCGQLHLRGCRIPKRNTLCENGLSAALRAIDTARLNASVTAVGLAQRAVDLSAAYLAGRETFGKPVLSNQAIRFRLAEMQTEIEAARWLAYHTASCIDAEGKGGELAAMCKLKATSTAADILRDCIRFFGAAGLDTHSEISRLMRFSHVLEITDGTNEIQKLIIGKGIARRCR